MIIPFLSLKEPRGTIERVGKCYAIPVLEYEMKM